MPWSRCHPTGRFTMLCKILKNSRSKPKIILILQGGLGNQLFSYAAGRRLALVNNAELVLDNISGFKHDYYRRSYCLNHFNIPQNLVAPEEAAAHLGKYGRVLLGKVCRWLPVNRRPYLLEQKEGFDPRIYTLKITRTVYMEGYWQSEKYFADIAKQIRNEFQIVTPHSPENVELASRIKDTTSVCLHTRLLHGVSSKDDAQPSKKYASLSVEYFTKAMDIIAAKVEKPHFFVFSDCPDWVRQNIKSEFPVTIATHNRGDAKNYEDLWLMTLCKHFIISNSTFSWWGAWLSNNQNKIVVAPNPSVWNVKHFSESLILDNWIKI